jgi:hypothetical protein
MCQTIVINNGEHELETPREFIEFFGFEPLLNKHYKSLNINSCFCQCDLESTFKANNITFEKDFNYNITTKKP